MSTRDFLAAAPHLVAEIINGTLRTQARPASRHAPFDALELAALWER